MSRFRKFCDFIFVLSLVLSAGSFACAWFDVQPIASFMNANKDQMWLMVALLVYLAIDGIGIVVILLQILFVRSKRSYQKISNDAGSITISKAAIRHVVDQVVYEYPEFRSIKTFVYLKGGHKPALSIIARVAPRGVVATDEVGQKMQAEIKASVEKFTGEPVHDVTLDVRENRDLSDVMDEDDQTEPEQVETEDTTEMPKTADSAEDTADVAETAGATDAIDAPKAAEKTETADVAHSLPGSHDDNDEQDETAHKDSSDTTEVK